MTPYQILFWLLRFDRQAFEQVRRMTPRQKHESSEAIEHFCRLMNLPSLYDDTITARERARRLGGAN